MSVGWGHGGGGGPGLRHPPVPPRVLRDSGVGAMAPTAHASLSSNHPCFERRISKLRRSTNVVCCKVKDHHNHCGHTYPSAAPASQQPPAASPNPPQTHIPPGGMHAVVVGRASPPPPTLGPPPRANPPHTPSAPPQDPLADPPPPQLPTRPPPPALVLTDSLGAVASG